MKYLAIAIALLMAAPASAQFYSSPIMYGIAVEPAPAPEPLPAPMPDPAPVPDTGGCDNPLCNCANCTCANCQCGMTRVRRSIVVRNYGPYAIGGFGAVNGIRDGRLYAFRDCRLQGRPIRRAVTFPFRVARAGVRAGFNVATWPIRRVRAHGPVPVFPRLHAVRHCNACR